MFQVIVSADFDALGVAGWGAGLLEEDLRKRLHVIFAFDCVFDIVGVFNRDCAVVEIILAQETQSIVAVWAVGQNIYDDSHVFLLRVDVEFVG